MTVQNGLNQQDRVQGQVPVNLLGGAFFSVLLQSPTFSLTVSVTRCDFMYVIIFPCSLCLVDIRKTYTVKCIRRSVSTMFRRSHFLYLEPEINDKNNSGFVSCSEPSSPCVLILFIFFQICIKHVPKLLYM